MHLSGVSPSFEYPLGQPVQLGHEHGFHEPDARRSRAWCFVVLHVSFVANSAHVPFWAFCDSVPSGQAMWLSISLFMLGAMALILERMPVLLFASSSLQRQMQGRDEAEGEAEMRQR